ncbi:hypothetical protein [Enterococcus casseliflavus]|uniref:hypothetical protein n=1 Tax=Enterococcus casseliflavus TaxID=37734 RepID=UPI0001B6DB6F|nr:hypothetical protein [Enterococcus casseliflavus]EEV29480.1 conserved hypothetical protein [Enterococcus casseliflavus EC30]EEV35976.1 conserved hypothetical protein [Enterococcus casseliflavus EC10]
MARVYKAVRLAYEAKIWIDKLIIHRERELKNELKNGLINKLETDMQEHYSDLLDGISFNVVLKVSAGSVIEQAYRYCKKQNFTDDDWEKIQNRMDRTIVKENYKDKSSVTPRLYLDENVLDGLEEYRYNFKSDEPSKRLPRLSYIIKLIIFAFYSQID